MPKYPLDPVDFVYDPILGVGGGSRPLPAPGKYVPSPIELQYFGVGGGRVGTGIAIGPDGKPVVPVDRTPVKYVPAPIPGLQYVYDFRPDRTNPFDPKNPPQNVPRPKPPGSYVGNIIQAVIPIIVTPTVP